MEITLLLSDILERFCAIYAGVSNRSGRKAYFDFIRSMARESPERPNDFVDVTVEFLIIYLPLLLVLRS